MLGQFGVQRERKDFTRHGFSGGKTLSGENELSERRLMRQRNWVVDECFNAALHEMMAQFLAA
jgi:hypothetical protein